MVSEHFSNLEIELNRIREEAAEVAAFLVRKELNNLHTAFPRHTFSLVQGMGCEFVVMRPPIKRDRLREKESTAIWEGWYELGAFDSCPALREGIGNISEILALADEVFGIDVGDVEP